MKGRHMATGNTVRDGHKLSNDDLGALARKFRDIARRIEEGSIDLPATLKSLQSVAEGKVVPEIQYAVTARPQEFKQPPEEDRKRSLGAIERRLSLKLQRLEWPTKTPEHIIVELWEAANIPSWGSNNGRVPIDAILDTREGSGTEMFDTFHGSAQLEERDVLVVNSTIQWLGTNIGMSFLRKFLAVSQMHVN
jgi:hypothetical protein